MPLLCWNILSSCMSSLFVQSISRTGKYPWGCARSAPSHVCTCLPGDHTWNLAYMTRRINIATANCKLHCVIYIMFFVQVFIFQKVIKVWTNDRPVGHKNPLATHPKRLMEFLYFTYAAFVTLYSSLEMYRAVFFWLICHNVSSLTSCFIFTLF